MSSSGSGGVAAFEPSAKVIAAHSIPHLLPGKGGVLSPYDSTFNINSTDYLLSLLPLPVIIAAVGFFVVLAFVIGILLRFLLLTCKLFVRRCVPGAEHCNLCCVCCTKGCTHPESRCSKCCCCHREVTAISRERERAATSVSTQIRRHNFRRCCILEVHSFILVLLLTSAGVVFYGQQEISKALAHIVRAMGIASNLFSGVASAASAVLLDLEAVTNSLVTAPCSPWVPQSDQAVVMQHTAKLSAASEDISNIAAPILAKLSALSVFLSDVVDPTVTSVVVVFFLLLVLICFLYAVGELYQSRLLMRASLALSTLIVIALTATCTLTMVIVTVLADFCLAPAANTLSLIGDHDSILYREVEYYTTCATTNPFSLDVDTSVLHTSLLNSTLLTISNYVTISSSCSGQLFARTSSLAQSITTIQALIDCHRVHAFWHEAVNLGFCTSGIEGLFDVWVNFFICSGLLFFAMVGAHVWYTWYLRLDVIGVGWFRDEDVRDTEEFKYQVQMMDIDLRGARFGFGALDAAEGGAEVEEGAGAGVGAEVEDGIAVEEERGQEQQQQEQEQDEGESVEQGQVELQFDIEGVAYNVSALKL